MAVVAPGLAGTRHGPYRIGDELARGGFGVVYRVTDDRGRGLALKVLHAEMAQFPAAVARFEREARAVNAVRHRNVVDIVDFGTLDDGRPFFVTELLRGRDLHRLLEERGRLPAAEVAAIVGDVCAALAAAHDAGVVHRDVKASNVFLCEGPQRRVVLLDFGIAKLLDNDPGLTASRHVLGTPSSMSPEQVQCMPVDGRTDVYAVGALIYQLVTGVLPFRDDSIAVMHDLHLYAERPRPGARVPGGAIFDDVVRTAMARRPDDRYPDVRALAAAVQAVMDPGPTAPLPTTGVHARIEIALATDDPDDEVLDRFDDAIPAARQQLIEAGFAVTLATGNSLLSHHAGADRAAAIAALAALVRDGPLASPALAVTILAAASARELASAWPGEAGVGVAATAAAVDGVEVPTRARADGLLQVIADPNPA